MTVTPYNTSTIRSKIKTMLDAITSAELYPGYLTRPSQLDNDKVPTYYIQDTGFDPIEQEKSFSYYDQKFNIVLLYDNPETTTATEAIDKIKDAVRVTLSNRSSNLDGYIEFFVPDSVSGEQQQDIQLGDKWYLSYTITVSVRVHDIVI